MHTTPKTNTACGPLATRTLDDLGVFFAARGHHPSPAHWGALADIAMTLEAMANREAAAGKVYLSAVDPGVGKTQTVIHFARALVASAAHRDVGMLICVGRIAEAEALAEGMGEAVRPFMAVLTSDHARDASWSGTTFETAQVLITTQQRIEKATDGRHFDQVGAFHYRGLPRRVRAWDEAWLPGAAVTLGRDELLSLLLPLRPVFPDLAGRIEDFALDLKSRVADGALIEVPDFEHVCGVSMAEVLATIAARTGRGGNRARVGDDQHKAATMLSLLSGRTARVMQDGRTGNTVLTHRDTLPTDLYPLLVLDASGRVRQTYQDVEEHRGTLVRLKAAPKDYSSLTVHVWRTPGSKSGWEKNGETLLHGIADAVMTKPEDQWLVVVHRPDRKVGNVEARLRTLLPHGLMAAGNATPEERAAARVQVITWGQHMATNAFADVGNVILAGTLFMPPSHYVALTHLAQDRDVAAGFATREEVDNTQRGEHAHHLLQAVCRGRLRRLDGDKCLPMDAYVIASPQSGIAQDLQRIFPGCQVHAWNEGPKKLPRKLAAACNFVRQRVADGATLITCKAIQEAADVDPSNFGKLVTRHPEWEDLLEELNLERCGSRKRTTAYRLVASAADDAVDGESGLPEGGRQSPSALPSAARQVVAPAYGYPGGITTSRPGA